MSLNLFMSMLVCRPGLNLINRYHQIMGSLCYGFLPAMKIYLKELFPEQRSNIRISQSLSCFYNKLASRLLQDLLNILTA